MTSAYRSWVALLTAAATAIRSGSGPAGLATAQEGLRLVWATARSVRINRTGHDGLWWIRLVEATVSLAARLDRATGAPGTRLGSGPTPDGWLVDAPGLRKALVDLLAAIAALQPPSSPRRAPAAGAPPGLAHPPGRAQWPRGPSAARPVPIAWWEHSPKRTVR
jgi:hypothetical protein